MGRDEPGRKAGRNFASLRATFSRSTVAVNEVPEKDSVKKPARDEPKTLPKAKSNDRRQARFSVLDLFSKPKVQTARGYHESGLDAVSEQPAPQLKLSILEDRPTEIIERAEPRPSRRHVPSPLPLVQEHTVPEQLGKADVLDALPLFRAHSHSIRHGTLQTPATSMDSLVRAQHMRKQAGFLNNGSSLPAVRENGDGEVQEIGKVSKRMSMLNETPELADKLFVLVTAGQLVQYAADGNYDRMPERVLQLSSKSAAFACDLIPGKHWVVQVTQQMQADVGSAGGQQINKSRSILSRLRGPAVSRRSTGSVLLVFNSAEDMTGWLQALRGMIESLGGAKKKEDGEAGIVEEADATAAADEQSGHRHRASRPASMISTTASAHRPRSTSSFSQPRSPRSPVEMSLPPVPSTTHLSPHNTPGNSPKDASFPAEVRSLIGAAASHSPMDSSVASSEHSRLERLREGSRASMVSTRTADTDNMTVPTSKCSSSPPSPVVETFDEQSVRAISQPNRTSYIAPLPSSRRLSVQPVTPTESTKVEGLAIPQPMHEPAQLPEELMGTITVDTPTPSPPKPINRVSQNFSHPINMPFQLRLSDSLPRPQSEVVEPWTKRSRPDSVLGQLPSISTRSLNRLDSVSKRGRPLSRMVPVKPFDPSNAPPERPIGPGQAVFPRRYSSLPSVGTQIGAASSRTTTPDLSTPSPGTTADSPDLSLMKSTPPSHRPRMPSLPITINTSHPSPSQQTATQGRGGLRRPTSMQIRSDPAPFLSQRRTSMNMRPAPPVATANSYFAGATPSNDFFHKTVPVRASSVNFGAPSPSAVKPLPAVTPPVASSTTILSNSPSPPPPAVAPPIPPMNPGRAAAIRSRTSMPAMMLSGLPPPAPPPSMPLPPPPPGMALLAPPPNMPLPSLPPNLPLPSLPPNVPLPSLPPGLPLPSRPPTIPLPPVPNQAISQ